MKDLILENLVKTHAESIKEVFVENDVFGNTKMCKITFKDGKHPEKTVGFTKE
jgi:hypothetical protein